MKKLYWICNHFERTFEVISPTLARLWGIRDGDIPQDDRIRSEIIQVGSVQFCQNNYELPSVKEEDQMNRKFAESYRNCCIAVDGPDPERPTFHANLPLVSPQPVHCLMKRDNTGDIYGMLDLNNVWLNPSGSEDEEQREKERQIMEKLVALMGIEEGNTVGISAKILPWDYRLLNRGKRVLSMELYYLLSEKGYRCFLYSDEQDGLDFKGNWLETYRALYDGVGTEDIAIIGRKWLVENKHPFRSYEEITRMIGIS